MDDTDEDYTEESKRKLSYTNVYEELLQVLSGKVTYRINLHVYVMCSRLS